MAYYGIELERYIREEHANGNPLASAILPGDATMISVELANKLNVLSQQLDFSPESLVLLEKSLQNHYVALGKELAESLNDEAIWLVRAIGAYLGKVLEVNLAGQWRSFNNGLLDMQIKIEPSPSQEQSPIPSKGKVLLPGREGVAAWAKIIIDPENKTTC